MSAIPLTKEELLSLKVGDKVISSHQFSRANKLYYEVIALHGGNIVVAKRFVIEDKIIDYERFMPATDYNGDGSLINKWFRVE